MLKTVLTRPAEGNFSLCIYTRHDNKCQITIELQCCWLMLCLISSVVFFVAAAQFCESNLLVTGGYFEVTVVIQKLPPQECLFFLFSFFFWTLQSQSWLISTDFHWYIVPCFLTKAILFILLVFQVEGHDGLIHAVSPKRLILRHVCYFVKHLCRL